MPTLFLGDRPFVPFTQVTRVSDKRAGSDPLDPTIAVRTADSRARVPGVSDDNPFGSLSPSMHRVMVLAARVAPLDSTVLITGESGVGKERLARWLHENSPRARALFVPVNCGAFTDALLESELFGHVRGAFTGAVHDRLGVFEVAHGGTLFLDEIGDVSPAMQVRLLRVIQEREVRRVGESKARPVDVRLISATHRDLTEEIVETRFRRDLYYRLRVIDLQIPPLRERPEDLRELARDLLERAATRLHRPIVGYTAVRWIACSHISGQAISANWSTRLSERARSRPVRTSTSRTCPTTCASQPAPEPT